MSYCGEVCQSPPTVGWPSCSASWWSWAAMQLTLMTLWTVNVNHLLVTAVNRHKYTYVLYQSEDGIWLAPSAGVVCSDLRCREHSLFFAPKGLLGLLYQAATRQSLPICYWSYSSFKVDGTSFQVFWICKLWKERTKSQLNVITKFVYDSIAKLVLVQKRQLFCHQLLPWQRYLMIVQTYFWASKAHILKTNLVTPNFFHISFFVIWKWNYMII